MKDLLQDVGEWVDCGPGSLIIRTVTDYEHRKKIVNAIRQEVELREGDLRVWEKVEDADAQIPTLDPEQHAVVVLISPGEGLRWADCLKANREALRFTMTFMLVLVFKQDLASFCMNAPDFVSWAKENGSFTTALLREPERMDLDAACEKELGLSLDMVRKRWQEGTLVDTAGSAFWAAVALQRSTE